jgi:hypothetical protein
MTCAGCLQARTRLKGIVGAAIQQVIPKTRKRTMPATEYLILFYDGRETLNKVDLPPGDETGKIGKPSENMKKRWALVREIAQDVIGADNDVEHVNVWHNEKYLDMFVDETGVLKELPFNNKATTIYRANWKAHEPNPGPDDELPYIAGNAVLFMEKVW